MAPLLAVTDLHVALGGRPVLHGVSLACEAGETLALVGASGSGKTTLLRALIGLLPAGAETRGAVRYAGVAPAVELLRCPAARWRALRGAHIAWIPQAPQAALDPRQSARSHLRECLGAHRRGGAGEVAGWLERVGLPAERAGEYPHQWSGGMQQRLLVAMALAQRPRLLLADEPTSALDTLRQAQLLELLGERRRGDEPGGGAALCLVTHDLAVAAVLADQVCVLEAGRIIEQGTAAQVFRHPRHPYTAAMVAHQPTMPAGAAAGERA